MRAIRSFHRNAGAKATAAALTALAALAALLIAACAPASDARACVPDGQPLDFGFYAFFAPISSSAVEDAASPSFTQHAGYEADLLDALEAMDGAGLAFNRYPVKEWTGVWLLPSVGEFDIVGGGITPLQSRTLNADGDAVIAFTDGHLTFAHSLLARAEDAARLSSWNALTSDVKVGVLAGTTGEFRMLQLTGFVDGAGALAPGTRVVVPSGEIVSDGGGDFIVKPGAQSPALDGRRFLHPPSDDMPQVVYLGDELGEPELLAALADGAVDALARWEIGNRDAAARSNGAFAVSAIDSEIKLASFALPIDNPDLLACLNDKINYLTDDRAIGYPQWTADPDAFMRRARQWQPQ